MQKFIKWMLGSLLLCSGVLAASQSYPVTAWIETKPPTHHQAVKKSVLSPAIVKLEQQVKQTQFDKTLTSHSLRFQRIVYYLSEARQYDAKHWEYNRDEALTRAANILRHHQVNTGQRYEI